MKPVASRNPYTQEETNRFRFWRPCGTLLCYRAFMNRIPLVARVFYLVLVFT